MHKCFVWIRKIIPRSKTRHFFPTSSWAIGFSSDVPTVFFVRDSEDAFVLVLLTLDDISCVSSLLIAGKQQKRHDSTPGLFATTCTGFCWAGCVWGMGGRGFLGAVLLYIYKPAGLGALGSGTLVIRPAPGSFGSGTDVISPAGGFEAFSSDMICLYWFFQFFARSIPFSFLTRQPGPVFRQQFPDIQAFIDSVNA